MAETIFALSPEGDARRRSTNDRREPRFPPWDLPSSSKFWSRHEPPSEGDADQDGGRCSTPQLLGGKQMPRQQRCPCGRCTRWSNSRSGYHSSISNLAAGGELARRAGNLQSCRYWRWTSKDSAGRISILGYSTACTHGKATNGNSKKLLTTSSRLEAREADSAASYSARGAKG
jgi:hypothetical protein